MDAGRSVATAAASCDTLQQIMISGSLGSLIGMMYIATSWCSCSYITGMLNNLEVLIWTAVIRLVHLTCGLSSLHYPTSLWWTYFSWTRAPWRKSFRTAIMYLYLENLGVILLYIASHPLTQHAMYLISCHAFNYSKFILGSKCQPWCCINSLIKFIISLVSIGWYKT